jgi:4-hydroxy-tetrahydrodipicolinate reductase
MSNQNAQTISIIVSGAAGRMGRGVCRAALDDDRFTLVAAACRPGSTRRGRRAVEEHPRSPTLQNPDEIGVFADVVIDFSTDPGARAAVEIARRARAALLVGTTALTGPTLDAIRDLARDHAVMIAPNTSPGVALMARLAAIAASQLGENYDCSLVEAHHAAKQDAPSGTAIRLAQAVREHAKLPDNAVLSIRGGDVVGEHTIRFAGPGEYIQISHTATSRDLFVHGALRAAAWLRGREAGIWTIEDSLNLSAR